MLAQPSALGGRGAAPVGVGRYAKTAAAGKATFAVALNAAAKKALRRAASSR